MALHHSTAQPLFIPAAPEVLRLPIHTHWNGAPEQNPRLHGDVILSACPEGLLLTMSLPHQEQPRIPAAAVGTRVADLWTYDVVECFLSGPDGYTEIELGAGGHFLVLCFSAPRVRADACEHLQPSLQFEPHLDDPAPPHLPRWSTRMCLPWKWLPQPITSGNAYVIVREQYLCFEPLPGPKPDFHQPLRFPPIMLTPEAERLRSLA